MRIGVRSMDKEGVVTAIKNFILPELKEIKDNQAKMSIRLDAVEKRLSDINGHLVDQSRRIDETNKRIDEVRTELSERIDEVRTELTGRIDATNNRIDQLTFQVGKIAQEMERIKREESVTSDILTRLRALEQKTANL